LKFRFAWKLVNPRGTSLYIVKCMHGHNGFRPFYGRLHQRETRQIDLGWNLA